MQIKRLLHLKLFDAYSPLLPLTASLLLFAFVISLWWTLEQREHRAIKERVLMDATNFSRSIELNLLTRILALQRFSKRMENAKSLQKEIFEAEAQAYINDFPGFEVIEWVDSDHHILWVVPEVDNEILKGLNLRLDKKQFELLTLAKEKREPIVSSIVNLIQGAKGVRIYLSIFQGKEH